MARTLLPLSAMVPVSALSALGSSPTSYTHVPSLPSADFAVRTFRVQSSSVTVSYSSTISRPSSNVVCTFLLTPDTMLVDFPPFLSIFSLSFRASVPFSDDDDDDDDDDAGEWANQLRHTRLPPSLSPSPSPAARAAALLFLFLFASYL